MLKPINMIRNAVKPLGAILVASLMTLSSPVAAQDFQKGLAAYNAGDYVTAIQEWTPLAGAGDASAQYVLGVIYSTGQGVLQDNVEAVKWYRLAADQGYAQAQFNLGVMYSNGQGIPQDYAEAVKWWRLAADQGNAFAQANLGYMYSKGQGVLQDNVMAHMWYNIASANGQDKFGEWRDKTAGLMTPADISKAQAMARECMSSGYTKCGY